MRICHEVTTIIRESPAIAFRSQRHETLRRQMSEVPRRRELTVVKLDRDDLGSRGMV
jgi:hypothetical protein